MFRYFFCFLDSLVLLSNDSIFRILFIGVCNLWFILVRKCVLDEVLVFVKCLFFFEIWMVWLVCCKV